ncbi:MAG: hypothetical protein LBE12_19005 [Planctomycetaceae bacterium]|jgi:hypothetical protein|nr:hypothetical protein [Planctomycetaceae bacterium]
MKKLLILAIVFSLSFILNGVSFAQETDAPVKIRVIADEASQEVGQETVVTEESESVVVENGAVQGCYPIPYRPCPLRRPFVRRACTPCVAAPCNPCPPPCPPCAPHPPVYAPVPRKLCNAPILPQPCQAYPVEQTVCPYAESYGDPCGYGYVGGYRPSFLRNLFARLFSRLQPHGYLDPYYGYGCPEFGYGIEFQNSPCESN